MSQDVVRRGHSLPDQLLWEHICLHLHLQYLYTNFRDHLVDQLYYPNWVFSDFLPDRIFIFSFYNIMHKDSIILMWRKSKELPRLWCLYLVNFFSSFIIFLDFQLSLYIFLLRPHFHASYILLNYFETGSTQPNYHLISIYLKLPEQ